MKKFFLTLLYLFAAAAVLLGVYLAGCRSMRHSAREKVYEIVTLHDTTILSDTVRETHKLYIPVPAKVDTSEILREYFAVRSYRDTIVDMPDLKVTLTETATRNILSDRQVFVSWKERTVFQEPRNRISLGISYGIHPMAQAVYSYKRFGIGAGMYLDSRKPYVSLNYTIREW